MTIFVSLLRCSIKYSTCFPATNAEISLFDNYYIMKVVSYDMTEK